jgi:hypothetical protein
VANALRVARGYESAMNSQLISQNPVKAKFAECTKCEVRRIHIAGSRVNKARHQR